MSFQNVFVLFLLVAGAFSISTIINDGAFILDTSINSTNFTIKITANTTGYVGFGISPTGAMQGSDLVIGGFNATSNQSYVGDYFATTAGPPQYDSIQNVQLISASENETHTTLEFTRLLNTTDPQDHPILNETQYILWSMGATDDITHHTGRGSVQLNLYDDLNN